MTERHEQTIEVPKPKNTLYCLFCGKSQHEVLRLIASPGANICNECVELCVDIEKEGANRFESASTGAILTSRLLSEMSDADGMSVQDMFSAMTGAVNAPVPEGFGGRSVKELLQPVLDLASTWANERAKRRLQEIQLSSLDKESQEARAAAETKIGMATEELRQTLAQLEEKRQAIMNPDTAASRAV